MFTIDHRKIEFEVEIIELTIAAWQIMIIYDSTLLFHMLVVKKEK